MNNIGIRPTFKKKKLSYIFHLIELGLSVYDWGKPCLLLILSPRLCLVCCFSVFVPTPSLGPKISFTSRGWVGARAPSGSFLNKLPMKWYFVQGFMESCLSESWSAPPPLAPLIFWKVCTRPWIFLVNMIKSTRVRSHMHAYVNKMNWTVPPPNFYQWNSINNDCSIFCLF